MGDGGTHHMSAMVIRKDLLGELISHVFQERAESWCICCGSEACELGYLCGQCASPGGSVVQDSIE